MNDRIRPAPVSRNVSRAVARSRSVRAAIARRRRRMAAVAACLASVVGLPVAWIMAEPASLVAAAAASEIHDLAELLSQRSPGARTQAELTKHAREAAKARPRPKPLVPPGHPIEPGVPTTTELVDLLQPPVAPVSLVAEGAPPSFEPTPTLNAILASAPLIGSFTPPTSGGAGGGGGGGSGGGGGGGRIHLPTSEPQEALPQTSAVPEPGTWAMMLMGFGLIAWQTRRRRTRLGAKVPTPAAN